MSRWHDDSERSLRKSADYELPVIHNRIDNLERRVGWLEMAMQWLRVQPTLTGPPTQPSPAAHGSTLKETVMIGVICALLGMMYATGDSSGAIALIQKVLGVPKG